MRLMTPASTSARTSKTSAFTKPSFGLLTWVYSDWCPPCLYYPLGSDENDTQLFWMAPAPGGPGPWNDTGNYTVGSWGPSSGVKTLWRDEEGNYSSLYEYPGTGEVDEYWRDNIWTFYAIWDD